MGLISLTLSNQSLIINLSIRKNLGTNTMCTIFVFIFFIKDTNLKIIRSKNNFLCLFYSSESHGLRSIYKNLESF